VAKNPVFKKKYEEGYNDGFQNGAEFGRIQAIKFFAAKLSKLKDAPGIGNKTFQKVKKQLGEQYFDNE